MKLWIARKQSGRLLLFNRKPKRVTHIKMRGPNSLGTWEPVSGWGVPLNESKLTAFPEVTWENSPQEVELQLGEIAENG